MYTGVRGFHPQPSKIVSIAEESWIGIKAMAMLVDQKFKSVDKNDSITVGPTEVVNTSSAKPSVPSVNSDPPEVFTTPVPKPTTTKTEIPPKVNTKT